LEVKEYFTGFITAFAKGTIDDNSLIYSLN